MAAAEWSRNSSDLVTETWATLADAFGPRFHRDFGEKAPTVWNSAIRSLTTAQIQRGIRRLCAAGSGHPPTLPQFVKACREVGGDEGETHPRSTYLPHPPMHPLQGAANSALLSLLRTKGPASEACLKHLVALKNQIVSSLPADSDPAEVRDVLLGAFEKHWVPMPESERASAISRRFGGAS